jgi:uncharacterized membrane protein
MFAVDMARHGRFFIALLVGAAATAASLLSKQTISVHALIGANSFFVSYLAMTLLHASQSTADDLRRHGDKDDEGLLLIFALTAGTVVTSLAAIAVVLIGQEDSAWGEKTLALLAVPLGWAMVQTLAGFHYAHRYYRHDEDGITEGLDFPGKNEPGPWDFLYFAYCIGMTAQVSDVQVTTTATRRAVLVHAVTSFFYNTCLLALAVNAAVSLAT